MSAGIGTKTLCIIAIIVRGNLTLSLGKTQLPALLGPSTGSRTWSRVTNWLRLNSWTRHCRVCRWFKVILYCQPLTVQGPTIRLKRLRFHWKCVLNSIVTGKWLSFFPIREHLKPLFVQIARWVSFCPDGVSFAQNTTPNPVLYSAVTHPFLGYVFTQNTPNATPKHAFSWPDFESWQNNPPSPYRPGMYQKAN